MPNSKNRLLLYLTIPIAVLIFSLFAVQWWAKKELKDVLENKIPPNVNLKYEDLDLNIFEGRLMLKNVALDFKNNDTSTFKNQIYVDEIVIEGINYLEYLLNKNLALDNISLESPKIIYFPSDDSIGNPNQYEGIGNKTINSFSLDRFEIMNGRVTLMRKGIDSTRMSVKNIDFSIEDIKTDTVLIKQKIPIKYGSYSISSQDIFVDSGPLLIIKVAALEVANQNLSLKDLVLKTKYSKEELSKVIKTERDHLNLTIPEVLFNGIDFGFHKERFFTTISEILISGAKLDIFRDKQVPDDMRYKPLYSKMLRDLPLDLSIEKTSISDSNITLEHLIEAGVKPGKIFFADINASIEKLANMNSPGQKTIIDAKSQFMGNAPVHLKWTFDSKSKSDEFLIAGSVQNFDPSTIDSFLKSGLKVEADGYVDQIYFTATGNNSKAVGDMAMKYDDLKLTLLQQDRKETKKFLTFIGNLFVNKDSKSDGEGYRHGTIKVERNTNKTFFNYLWISVRSGIVNTVSGM